MRQDLATIAHFVPSHATALDIGCGEGELLSFLSQEKQVDARGIEIDREGVNRCLQKGLAVIQGDADQDLMHYPDNAFDYAISSQMLQTTHDPKHVLLEMLRIAKQVIISVPNFGHWYNRYHLTSKGRMPVSKTLSYAWYETPNIHFCTIKDFIRLCDDINCEILASRFLHQMQPLPNWLQHPFAANLFSDLGVFLIRKR